MLHKIPSAIRRQFCVSHRHFYVCMIHKFLDCENRRSLIARWLANVCLNVWITTRFLRSSIFIFLLNCSRWALTLRCISDLHILNIVPGRWQLVVFLLQQRPHSLKSFICTIILKSLRFVVRLTKSQSNSRSDIIVSKRPPVGYR